MNTTILGLKLGEWRGPQFTAGICDLVNYYSRPLLGYGTYEPLTVEALEHQIRPRTMHRILLVILAYYYDDILDAKEYWCTLAGKLKRVEVDFSVPANLGSSVYDACLQNFYKDLLPFFPPEAGVDFTFGTISMEAPMSKVKPVLQHLLKSGELSLEDRVRLQELQALKEEAFRSKKAYDGQVSKLEELEAKVQKAVERMEKLEEEIKVADTEAELEKRQIAENEAEPVPLQKQIEEAKLKIRQRRQLLEQLKEVTHWL